MTGDGTAGEGTAADGTARRPGHLELEYVDPGRLENRASIALKVLAVINAFGVVLSLIPSNPPVATLWSVAFSTASAVLAAVLVVTVLALDREEPWAIAAIRPLFLVLGLGGLALLGVAVAEGRFRVPFDALFAAWVLLGRPSTRPMPRPDRRSIGVTLAAAILIGMMLSAGYFFRWGGVLDLRPQDLAATLTADCTAHEPGTGLPETIVVTYEWAWRTWQPFASGADVVVVGWDGDDATGAVEYFVGLTPETEPGVQPGHRDAPSEEMAAAVMAETRSQWAWGIALEEQGYRPGQVELHLRLVNGTAPAEPLRITATYIHEGVWRQDAAPVTCAW